MTSCFLIIVHPVTRHVLLGYKPHKRAWALPGGKAKKGETQRQSLLRECREELARFRLRGRLTWLKPVRRPSGKISRYAILEAGNGFSARPEEFSHTRFHPIKGLPVSSKKTRRGVKRLRRQLVSK